MKLTAIEQTHLALLEQWRGAMNLVGPGSVQPHFIDSVGAVSRLAAKGRWADLGSGAGFPGIALAARHRDAVVLLVESRQKRAAFLRRVITDAHLENARVFHGRVEDLEPGFDGVICRAYKAPEAFLADAARLLGPEGVAVVLTADTLPHQPGWDVIDAAVYPVVDGHRVRTVVTRTSVDGLT